MKKIGLALLYSIIIFFFSLTIAPMIPDIASNYKMNSSNAINAILFSLIFTVILCTMIVLDKIAEVNEKLDELKKQG